MQRLVTAATVIVKTRRLPPFTAASFKLSAMSMAALQWRALEPEDAGAAQTLASQAWGLGLHRVIDWQTALQPDENVRALGAWHGDGLSGLLMLRAMSGRRRGHAAHLYLGVAAAERGRGLGSQLLHQALRLADWMHIGRLELAVYDVGALDFVLKRGFCREVCERDAWHSDNGFANRWVCGHLRPTHDWRPSRMRQPAASPMASSLPGMLRVRDARVEDAAALMHISSSDSVMWGTLQTPHPSMALWRTRIALAAAPMLVAECNGGVVGCAGLHPVYEACTGHVQNLGMSVAADFQGLGVGRALLRTLIERAQQDASVRRLALQVYPDNPRAVRLYERCGFVHEGTVQGESWRYDGYTETATMARLLG